jgi:hypothetical protein
MGQVSLIMSKYIGGLEVSRNIFLLVYGYPAAAGSMMLTDSDIID